MGGGGDRCGCDADRASAGSVVFVADVPVVTLLPFQPKDDVLWNGEKAVVTEVRGDRIAVETSDGIPHITTEKWLRAMQPLVPKVGDNLA